jgi:hypothetical protein
MTTTSPNFTVSHVALHLIDKRNNDIRLSDREVDRSGFAPADNLAIDSFLEGHLRAIWTAPESNTIRAATFSKGSKIKSQYAAIKSKHSPFLGESAVMAQALFEVAPKNSSSGLLMAVWFTARGDRRQFLALLKMDPGKSDRITLRAKGDQLLLDLAVQHIERELPDPDSNNRVLKWAVTPHPTLAYDVKIKDSQSTPDPAVYFMNFLGCDARKTEKQQLSELFKSLPEPAINKLVPQIGAASVDGRVSLDSIKQSNTLTTTQLNALQQGLTTAGVPDLNISSQAIENARLSYHLSNEIVIKGPLLAMKRVQINRVGSDYEFRIRANDYEPFYE